MLASLSYKAALELGSAGDADVKVRRFACSASRAGVGSWQLAALSYKADLELGSAGEAGVQVCNPHVLVA
jgi:hypothetical protein